MTRNLLLLGALAIAAVCMFAGEHGAAGAVLAIGAAAAPGDSEQVDEYVLYRGAFDDEAKHPLFSDPDLELVNHVRLETLRSSPNPRPVLCISRRRCVYPLSGAGKRQAMGSTCEETEVKP